ncbi:MAG: ParB/RepB/Spo0J family partition protein [Thermoanaerobaculia bacterium]|nr:ParB/RepB/Spo0J family partition protein [Thermoanaerobaculia bacterium]
MAQKQVKKKVLGRGLGALIPETPAASAEPSREIEVGKIDLNPWQPRRQFQDETIDELAESVKKHGIIQPLVVTPGEKGRFTLIAGERRLRAARKAGLGKVPVVVRESADSEEPLALALIENIQREDLNAIDEALAYEQLHEEFGLTQQEIAVQVGKSRSTIANSLRLLKLPAEVQEMVSDDRLSMGHARAILSLGSARKQLALAKKIVRSGLSVRQAEMLASEPEPKSVKTEMKKDVFTRDAEEKLTRALHSRVEIDRKRRGGTIRIGFSNEDELIRLFEILSGQRRKA